MNSKEIRILNKSWVAQLFLEASNEDLGVIKLLMSKTMIFFFLSHVKTWVTGTLLPLTALWAGGILKHLCAAVSK